MCLTFFFFQAEDGIRDFCLSRGLGDVYKRQAACGPEDAAEPAAQAYVSPYDWSGLERSGDRLAFRENGEVRSQLGVDVSDHQGAIDWSAVASDGVDFAFVRVGNRGYTEGALYADTRYAENIDDATSAGWDVGADFFAQAVSVDEARENAWSVMGRW